jgi:hypothetical protein
LIGGDPADHGGGFVAVGINEDPATRKKIRTLWRKFALIPC